MDRNRPWVSGRLTLAAAWLFCLTGCSVLDKGNQPANNSATPVAEAGARLVQAPTTPPASQVESSRGSAQPAMGPVKLSGELKPPPPQNPSSPASNPPNKGTIRPMVPAYPAVMVLPSKTLAPSKDSSSPSPASTQTNTIAINSPPSTDRSTQELIIKGSPRPNPPRSGSLLPMIVIGLILIATTVTGLAWFFFRRRAAFAAHPLIEKQKSPPGLDWKEPAPLEPAAHEADAQKTLDESEPSELTPNRISGGADKS